VVSVLAIGCKVCGFKPGRGCWIFKADINPQYPFLRRGSRKILQHVKKRFEVRKRYFEGQNSFPSPVSPDLLLHNSTVRIVKELLWINQEFSLSISFHHSSPWSYIRWGMKLGPMVAAVQRRSLTPST
jgi:hypothetical protein